MSEHLDLLSLDAARTGPRPAHLDVCAECRAAFDGLRALEVRLAPSPVEVPAWIRAKLFKPRRRWAPVAAAAAVFLAVATLWLSPSNPRDVDGSGRVDIIDAYLRAAENREAAEALAREIVSIGGGSAR